MSDFDTFYLKTLAHCLVCSACGHSVPEGEKLYLCNDGCGKYSHSCWPCLLSHLEETRNGCVRSWHYDVNNKRETQINKFYELLHETKKQTDMQKTSPNLDGGFASSEMMKEFQEMKKSVEQIKASIEELKISKGDAENEKEALEVLKSKVTKIEKFFSNFPRSETPPEDEQRGDNESAMSNSRPSTPMPICSA